MVRRCPRRGSVAPGLARVDEANEEKQLVSDYVTVERADNEAMAELVKQRLEQGGIPCIVQSGGMAAVAGAGAAYAVTVPAENVDEAMQFLGE
jgi:predicted dinucleotide-utilizing enzyme